MSAAKLSHGITPLTGSNGASLSQEETRLTSLGRRDQASIWHPFTRMGQWCDPDFLPLVIERGEGCYLWDTAGKKYIDGNSTIWTCVHGHGHPGLISAMHEQLNKIAHVSFLGFTHPSAIKLAEKLLEISGTDGGRVFYSDNGSTAIEAALRIALEIRIFEGQPQRNLFLNFSDSYHGDTLGAVSAGSLDHFHENICHLGYQKKTLKNAEELLQLDAETASKVTAVIIEPLVRGAGGMKFWPAGMLREVRTWCQERDIFLIVDEVMTGFGRTGEMFAFQNENIQPDFIALGKGLTGGLSPLAATITANGIMERYRGELAEDRPLLYGHTYTGHPLGCAAALANIELFSEENTLSRVRESALILADTLKQAETCRGVASTRSLGMISAIEVNLAPHGGAQPAGYFATDGKRVCQRAQEMGLLTRAIGNAVVLMLPLCADAELIRTSVRIIAEAAASLAVGDD